MGLPRTALFTAPLQYCVQLLLCVARASGLFLVTPLALLTPYLGRSNKRSETLAGSTATACVPGWMWLKTLVWEWQRHMVSDVAAMCVQLVDASDNLAIHMTARILLRSSSTHEPSDPPLGVVLLLFGAGKCRPRPNHS